MISRRLYFSASALFVLISLPTYAANEAYELLTRIRQAARDTNYEGVFVYQNGPRLETMKIYHRAKGGSAGGSSEIRGGERIGEQRLDRGAARAEHRAIDERKRGARQPQLDQQGGGEFRILARNVEQRARGHSEREREGERERGQQ